MRAATAVSDGRRQGLDAGLVARILQDDLICDQPRWLVAGARCGRVIAMRAFLSRLGGIRLAFLGVSLRSEEHTSELQSLIRTSYADFCVNDTLKQILHIAFIL